LTSVPRRSCRTSVGTPSQKLVQLSQQVARVLGDVVPRVASKLVAAGASLALAAAVLLPGVARVVKAVAVELDGQSMLGPAAIDPPPASGAVGLRQRQPGVLQKLEEASLELAQHDVDIAARDAAQL